MDTVLITGSNRGIGFALTQYYLKQGFNVIACCRQNSQHTELKKLSLREKNLELQWLDVTDECSILKLAKHLAGRPIDYLINNAARFGISGNLLSIECQDWLHTLTTNTLGPLLLTRALLPNIKQGKAKKIVNISGDFGSIANNTSGMDYGYRASKAALNATMKNLSIELKPEAITVVNLHPGWVKTEMGGPNAKISCEASVKSMANIIQKINLTQSGCFLNYKGETIPW